MTKRWICEMKFFVMDWQLQKVMCMPVGFFNPQTKEPKPNESDIDIEVVVINYHFSRQSYF